MVEMFCLHNESIMQLINLSLIGVSKAEAGLEFCAFSVEKWPV